jgi:TP901 family phage tail tape measure protein
LFNAIEVASLFGTLELRDTATNTLKQFDSGLEATVNNMRRVGGELQGLGLAISAAVAPLVAFGTQGVRTAMSFDSSMAEISARTGTIGEELEQVRQLALQMGADTVFSAQDAADAMLELLASGQTVEQMMRTLPTVLTAAAASGEDLGTTADNITNILASFQLGVEDAAMVVDTLSRAAGASSADIGSLADGFANVGGVAAQFGLSVEETASILAIFAENGIKGSEAGTQLRSMLQNMSRDTDSVQAAWKAFGSSMYDAQGNLRPIGRILEDIEQASKNMTSEQRQRAMQDLAGSYGIMGLTALTSSIDMENMIASMDASADAASVAQARMNTFEGAMDSLGGSIETLQITVFTPFMNNVLRPLVQQITDVVNAINTWAAANPDAVNSIINVVLAVAGLGAGLLALGTVINFAATAMSGISLLIGALTSPIGLAVLAIGALIAALSVPPQQWEVMWNTMTFYANYAINRLVAFFWDNLAKPIGDALASIPTDTFVALAVGVGVLGGVLAIQAIPTAISAIATAVTAAAAAFGAWMIAAAPLIGILLVVGALVAAYATNWMGFRDTVNSIGDAIRNLASAMKGLASTELPWWLRSQDEGGLLSNWDVGSNLVSPGTGVANKPFVASSGRSVLGGSGTPFVNSGTAFDGGKPGPSKGHMTIQSLTVHWSSTGGKDDFEQFVANLEKLAAGA